MEPLVKLLGEWGPPFLGWILAGFLLWAYFKLVSKLLELAKDSTQAHNDVARTLSALEDKMRRLLQ